MYEIEIVAERFRGLTEVARQRVVNGVLREEMRAWHGVRVKTGVE
jgi:stress-induced morphogen